MARTNPFLLEYHKRENRNTELLIHILKETHLGSAFIGRLIGDDKLEPNRVVMDTLPYPADCKDGVIYPTSSEAKSGNLDAYFYFPDLKRSAYGSESIGKFCVECLSGRVCVRSGLG